MYIVTSQLYNGFNPRSPGGERLAKLKMRIIDMKFQSTLPGRGATISWVSIASSYKGFNPRSPGGERLLYLVGSLKSYTRFVNSCVFDSDFLWKNQKSPLF